MPEPLWKPGTERVRQSNMTDFTEFLSAKTGFPFPNYKSLHTWSIENLESFWEIFLEYSALRYSKAHTKVLSQYDMPGARWFTGMRLNYAENLLQPHHEGTAIESMFENSSAVTKISYQELRQLVARCVRGLRAAGIQKGDRVAGYVANVPEAIVACLAAASLGATWSSASPDFGVEAVLDRFGQVEPKIVFASTHYQYGGKIYRTDNVLQDLKEKLPSIEKIVSIPYPVGEANILGDIDWDQFLGKDDHPELTFEQVDFNHPLFILFSSGTTGAPKCMVHGTGGTLLQHKKELQLHSDIKPESNLLFFTTCGWMMWNWQLSALAVGATISLFDGSPGYPDLTAIWRQVDKNNVTHFGTSGRFLESCMKRQPPITQNDLGELSKLAAVLYTGSPLSDAGFRWVYDTIKPDVHLAGISGGTDIVSCFILGNPNLPVYAGEIQCKGLGVDVTAFDENGHEVSGQPGELVCRKPLPSMPVAFLNDPEGKKYHEAYFDTYPGVWCHGDYVEFTPRGGVIVYGRSDATLNPGGVRIGSAEIYAALDRVKTITGAVVVGWKPPKESDEIIVLLVVLSGDHSLDDTMQKEIRRVIREQCSPRHVPSAIFQIPEVPVTRSGKTVELSVKAILAGKPISNRQALANPHVLADIEKVRNRLLESHT